MVFPITDRIILLVQHQQFYIAYMYVYVYTLKTFTKLIYCICMLCMVKMMVYLCAVVLLLVKGNYRGSWYSVQFRATSGIWLLRLSKPKSCDMSLLGIIFFSHVARYFLTVILILIMLLENTDAIQWKVIMIMKYKSTIVNRRFDISSSNLFLSLLYTAVT